MANLVSRKRVDLCAMACRELERQVGREKLSWTVIGRGPLEGKIRLLAPESMHFIPKVDSLRAHFGSADVFVLPSFDEGFGMVYVEAIMCGCPVVCRRADGGQEIVDATGGGLAIDIPDSDRDATHNIVAAVNTILGDRQRYANETTRELARRMVDPERIRRQWEEVLNRV